VAIIRLTLFKTDYRLSAKKMKPVRGWKRLQKLMGDVTRKPSWLTLIMWAI